MEVINENNRATLGGAGCYSHPAQFANCVMISGGLALMILPSIVVGNEILILGCVLGLVAVWFFACRHGNLRGLVTSLPALAPSGAGTAAAAAPTAPGAGWNRPV